MENKAEQIKSQENLDNILRYGNLRGCRRKFLLRYFNEDYTEVNCGNCDGCVVQILLELSEINISIAKQKISSPSSINGNYNSFLFEELRNVRTQEARRLNVPPYMIFGDKALCEMATSFPQTKTAFLQVSGVGNQKLSQFGERFMSIIRNYMNTNKVKIITKPTYKGSTINETKKLLFQKISVNEIAKKRGLSPSTIMSHIEKISTSDLQVDLAYLKPPQERFEKIKEAFKKTGGFTLSPVREILGDSYSYDELRWARIFLNR